MPSFVEVGTLAEDAGDVGGDIQAGPAFMRSWSAVLDDGRWVTVDIYTYDAYDPDGIAGFREKGRRWVQTQAIATLWQAPGENEIRTEIAYWDRMGEQAPAREMCASLTIDDVLAAADKLAAEVD